MSHGLATTARRSLHSHVPVFVVVVVFPLVMCGARLGKSELLVICVELGNYASGSPLCAVVVVWVVCVCHV